MIYKWSGDFFQKNWELMYCTVPLYWETIHRNYSIKITFLVFLWVPGSIMPGTTEAETIPVMQCWLCRPWRSCFHGSSSHVPVLAKVKNCTTLFGFCPLSHVVQHDLLHTYSDTLLRWRLAKLGISAMEGEEQFPISDPKSVSHKFRHASQLQGPV